MRDPDRPISAPTLIKKMLLADPNLDVVEIDERLREQGMKMTRITISNIRSGFRHSLRVLIEEGLLPASVLEPTRPERAALPKRRRLSAGDGPPRPTTRREVREWHFPGEMFARTPVKKRSTKQLGRSSSGVPSSHRFRVRDGG
jgi:hypothetical protein